MLFSLKEKNIKNLWEEIFHKNELLITLRPRQKITLALRVIHPIRGAGLKISYKKEIV